MKARKKSPLTKKRQPSIKTKSHKAHKTKSQASQSLTAAKDTSEEKSKYQHPGETHPDQQLVDPSLRSPREHWGR